MWKCIKVCISSISWSSVLIVRTCEFKYLFKYIFDGYVVLEVVDGSSIVIFPMKGWCRTSRRAWTNCIPDGVGQRGQRRCPICGDESDVDVESWDEDGSRVGKGAWVDGRWHNPLDLHPVPQRESRSREALGPDYAPKRRQVMNTPSITMKHTINFHRRHVTTCRIVWSV